MCYIIYKVTNLINGKIYIGQTKRSLEIRKREHYQNSLIQKQIYFYRALRKYKPKDFKWQEWDNAETQEEANLCEQFWIKFYDSMNRGYNSTSGGESYQFNLSTRRKMSKSQRGRIFTPSHRRKLSLNHRNISGSNNPKAKRVKCNETHKIYATLTECAKELQVSRGSICNQLKGRTPTIRGYTFSYL